MIDKLDRRKEGLRSQACIMAETYRKGKTFSGVKEPIVDDDEVVRKLECNPKRNCVNYTETVAQIYYAVKVDATQSEESDHKNGPPWRAQNVTY